MLGKQTGINGFAPTRLARKIVVLAIAGLSFFQVSSIVSSGFMAYATTELQFFQVPGVVPLGILPNPDTNKLYLINSNKSITVVAQGSPQNVIAQINHPEYEEGEISFANLGLNQATNKLYLVAESSSGIYVIDGKSDSIIKKIDLRTWGVSIAVDSVASKIYVFGYGDVLHVINGFSDEIEDSVDIGQYIRDSLGPYDSRMVSPQIAVNPNTAMIYSLHYLSNLIVAINASTNEIVRDTTSVERPYAMLLNPGNDKLYVSGNQGPLTILDASSLQVITIIVGVGYGGAIPSMWRGTPPSGYSVYVPSSNGENISMIDAEDDRQLGSEVGGLGFPIWGLSANDKTGHAYATFDGSSNFLVADLEDFGRSSDERSSIDVVIEEREYSLGYNMSNGGSVLDVWPSPGAPPFSSLSFTISSPSSGYLDLAIPREMYDLFSFTDHELVASDDESDASVEILDTSTCDTVSVRIPVVRQSHTIGLGHSDLLGSHYHPYPPRITLEKTLVAEGIEFQLRVLTDAIKCDLLFAKDIKMLHIDIESNPLLSEGERGYFSIAIPRQLIGGNYTILIDGQPAKDVQIFTTALQGIGGTDPNTSTIAFSYDSTAKSVDIIGTEVIPEFGPATPLLAIAVAMLGGSLLLRSRANL